MDIEDEAPDLLIPDVPANNMSQVPLTIITGFLGAGKTSLLQYILNANHGYRIAVIMNEFTDSADIEGRAINVKGPDDPPDAPLSEEVLELANGCLCCSIRDSGVAAIEKLMHKRGRFDYIILETTGLADPGPIASMFWENESMSEALYLDGVVCVVDALYGMEVIEGPDRIVAIGASQVATADVILLNKVDLASNSATSPSLESTDAAIRKLNPSAPIYRTVRGILDGLRLIIGLNAYSSNPFRNPASIATVQDELDHEHSCVINHSHDEIGGISSMVISLPILDSDQAQSLDRWLSILLWEGRIPRVVSDPLLPEDAKTEILRCKGIFNTKDKETFLVQGVRTLYEITRLPDRKEGNDEAAVPGRLALIGRFSSGAARATPDFVDVRTLVTSSLSAALMERR
ncbi:CobW/HypB/UreG, nucleotide-binding domain-containing protein [Cantharellus anzutake]|uniref:CobW/HypB/UreG, nucleotide-binding domain-containing protein n=1 Tax=Cantharellus anzutake TaxID=1750568 RepID=UPI0019089805|nr:CobW/HypB/UreG, nucleotide-binding domain-containing protein [Cantharellus anzutake]KAF8333522.1 CobW/HypB/UreG, nucleotide-binding domain-containing protein [Cantharellus anzutake]